MFPKIKGTFFGVPIIRTIVDWSLCWGTLILGNYHLDKPHFLLQGLVFFGIGFRFDRLKVLNFGSGWGMGVQGTVRQAQV